MFDIIGLFLILIFTPLITINGMKYYKISTNKTVNVLTYIFLGLELLRFFYTAQFYPRAYMPAEKVTFTFVTFSLIACLFAAFNKNKLGNISKTVFTFTALIPVLLALVYPSIYINELDQYSVVKALYFVECGIVITIALFFLKEEIKKCDIKSLIFSLIFTSIYIFANAMRNIFWISNIALDLKWYLCMGALIISVCVLFGISLFLLKKEVIKKDE